MPLSGRVKAGVGAAVIALAAPFIAGWEGKENVAYFDRIANPPVWTVCQGLTGPMAYDGAKYTDSQCAAMFKEAVGEYYSRIETCMTNKSIPVSVQASLLELAYNVGTTGVCTSTMMRLANSGEYKAACAQLDRWVKAGGKTIRGLVNRRNASEAMCLQDVS